MEVDNLSSFKITVLNFAAVETKILKDCADAVFVSKEKIFSCEALNICKEEVFHQENGDEN